MSSQNSRWSRAGPWWPREPPHLVAEASTGRRSARHRRYRMRSHSSRLDRPPGFAVRGQHLTDLDSIASLAGFGDLDHAPIQENGQRIANGLPEIYVVSNVIENGVADRQPRLWGGCVAHGHVLSGRSSQGEHAIMRWRSLRPAAIRRSSTCMLRSKRCRNRCGNAPWVCGSNTMGPITAAAMSGRV